MAAFHNYAVFYFGAFFYYYVTEENGILDLPVYLAAVSYKAVFT